MSLFSVCMMLTVFLFPSNEVSLWIYSITHSYYFLFYWLLISNIPKLIKFIRMLDISLN